MSSVCNWDHWLLKVCGVRFFCLLDLLNNSILFWGETCEAIYLCSMVWEWLSPANLYHLIKTAIQYMWYVCVHFCVCACMLYSICRKCVICICVCARANVYTQALISKFDTSAFLECLPPYFLRQGLSLNLELTNSTNLAGSASPSDLSLLCLFSSRFTEMYCCMGLCTRVLGIQLKSSYLHSKHWLSTISPSPRISLFFVDSTGGHWGYTIFLWINNLIGME